MSEILALQWDWIDVDNRRIVWPDSKTGSMSKPMSDAALQLFQFAPRLEASPYVCPSIFDPQLPMSKDTYYKGWRRILERAGVPHIGTHGIRHRAATHIANSGIPVKVGMALTAHKTVSMFMRYVHTEDDPVRAAAEAVNQRRQSILASAPISEPSSLTRRDGALPSSPTLHQKPAGFDDGNYRSRTKVGQYRPFRHRAGNKRPIPPSTKRAPDH